MVSLKAKNPFASGSIEVLSVKTWVGIGAFAVVAAGAILATQWVMGRMKTVRNPLEDVFRRMRR